MAKKELFQNRISAFILPKINLIRLNRKGMDRGALKEGLKVLNRGKGLLIFPEGKRSRDGSLGEGQAGMALFAFGVGVLPVIPVFIRGTERAMPPKTHYIKMVKVRVVFGQPLIPDETIDRDNKRAVYQEFTKKVMQEIAALEEKAV